MSETIRITSDALGDWRKSSRCSNSGCVEVSSSENVIRVRDSKRADSPVLTFDQDEWRAFVDGVKNDEFNI